MTTSSAAHYYQSAARRHQERPLSAGYVDTLAHRARRGTPFGDPKDRHAHRKLCDALAGIADVVSSRHTGAAAHRGLSRDDLRQEAMRAMLEALWSWKPEKAAFRTYAYQRARFAAKKAVDSGHLVSVPRQIANAFMGEEANLKQVAKLSRETQAAARIATRGASSLSGTQGGESLGELDPWDVEVRERGYDEALNRLAIQQALGRARLTSREERALRAKAGLEEGGVVGLAAEFGVSDQRVHGIASKAIERVHTSMMIGGEKRAS